LVVLNPSSQTLRLLNGQRTTCKTHERRGYSHGNCFRIVLDIHGHRASPTMTNIGFILVASKVPGIPASPGIAGISTISGGGYFLGPAVTRFISEPTTSMYSCIALVIDGISAGV
jgi:hypothetical protein